MSGINNAKKNMKKFSKRNEQEINKTIFCFSFLWQCKNLNYFCRIIVTSL